MLYLMYRQLRTPTGGDFTNYIYDSPIGEIVIEYDETCITRLVFRDVDGTRHCQNEESVPNAVINQCVQELDEYFAGTRASFDVPIRLGGTAFQSVVWRALIQIPCGKTATYGQIAAVIGKPAASRAVGGANNKNPIYIIVPCHRVVGADGAMTGYGGGVWRKEWLLAHEMRVIRAISY